MPNEESCKEQEVLNFQKTAKTVQEKVEALSLLTNHIETTAFKLVGLDINEVTSSKPASEGCTNVRDDIEGSMENMQVSLDRIKRAIDSL